MKIAQINGDKHHLVKILDSFEGQFWLNTDLILKHINNQAPYDHNPHDVIAAEVGRDSSMSPWDVSDNLQLHTDNYFVHRTWTDENEVFNAGNVNASFELDLNNTETITRIWVWVDGLKMILGIDFMMLSVTANATLKFLDTDFPVGDIDVNIEVDYRQQYRP